MAEPGRGLEAHHLDCPYCGERVLVLLESDLRGEMVQDCEVCCHPWRLRVGAADGRLAVRVDPLDG